LRKINFVVYYNSSTGGNKIPLPSMTEFLAIPDYLDVTPKDFFDEGSVNPPLLQTLLDKLKTLSENDLLILYSLAERLEKMIYPKNGSHIFF
jgi:hypothetical protein